MDCYKINASAYVKSTLHVDMQPLYQRFLPLLPESAHILDAGCGSGRDARYFIEHGYKVAAFDATAEISALAEKESSLTQAAAAKAMKTTHPRLNEVLKGKIGKCSIDGLVQMLVEVGRHVTIKVSKAA